MANISQKTMTEINPKLSRISSKIHVDSIPDWLALKDDGLCTGVGTSLDPYIIEDLEIDGQGFGACITIDSKNIYFIIQNCTLFNADEAIVLQNVQHGKIMGNDIQHNIQGIYAWRSSYNTIKDNFINQNQDTGIYLDNADSNIITGNLATFCESGIRIDLSDNNQVSENTLENNNHGINSWIMNDNQVVRNSIRNNDVGINIGEKSRCNIISNNIFSNNGVDIAGEQEFCKYLILPITIGAITIVLIITLVLVIILIKRGKIAHRKKVSVVTPSIQNLQIEEKSIFKKERDMEEMYPSTQKPSQVGTTTAQKQKIEEEIIAKESEQQKGDLLNLELKSEEKDRSDAFSLQNFELRGEKLQEEEMKKKMEEISLVSDEDLGSPALEMESNKNQPDSRLETREQEAELKVQIIDSNKIICNYCGYLNEEDADFCIQCGQILKK